jgi:hypothetical protein
MARAFTLPDLGESIHEAEIEVVATLAKGLSQLSQQRQVQVIQAMATLEASDVHLR